MRSNRLHAVLVIIFLLVSRSAAATDSDTPSIPQLLSSPLTALHRINGVNTKTGEPLVTSREFALFNDIANGQAARWSPAEVALMAGGIYDENERSNYMAFFRQIIEEAGEATAGAETPEEKGDELARFLSKRACYGGYDSGDTDLRLLFNEGKYDCLTSSILFDIVAHAYGLKSHGVQIPHHIFVHFGDHYIDNCHVYSAEKHEGVVARIRAKHADSAKSAYGKSGSYETGEIGMIAVLYRNRSCYFSRDKHYAEATACDLKALCLDPRSPKFRQDVEADMRSWFNTDIEHNRVEHARLLVQVAGQLLGNRPSTSTMYQQLAKAMSQHSVRQLASAR